MGKRMILLVDPRFKGNKEEEKGKDQMMSLVFFPSGNSSAVEEILLIIFSWLKLDAFFHEKDFLWNM